MKRFSKENALSIKSVELVGMECVDKIFLVKSDKWETPHKIALSWHFSRVFFTDLTSGEESFTPYNYNKCIGSVRKCFDVIDNTVNNIEKRQAA